MFKKTFISIFAFLITNPHTTTSILPSRDMSISPAHFYDLFQSQGHESFRVQAWSRSPCNLLGEAGAQLSCHLISCDHCARGFSKFSGNLIGERDPTAILLQAPIDSFLNPCKTSRPEALSHAENIQCARLATDMLFQLHCPEHHLRFRLGFWLRQLRFC